MSSIWRSYLQSSPRAKALLGSAVIAWGAAGLLLSDRAESGLGLKPSAEDEQRLQQGVDRYVPRISAVDRRGMEDDKQGRQQSYPDQQQEPRQEQWWSKKPGE